VVLAFDIFITFLQTQTMIRGPIHEANIQQFLSKDSCKTKSQCILEKGTLKKYDLQESYNNFKIKLKILL